MRSDNVRRAVPKVNTKYGAPMGRSNTNLCEVEVYKGEWFVNTGKLYDKRVPMVDGVYDINGS